MDDTQDNLLLHPINSQPRASAEDERTPSSFWELYNQRAEAYDNEKIKGSTDTLNVLILFATLFAAVLTPFVIESQKLLQEDSESPQVTRDILLTISRQLANATTDPYHLEDFSPPRYAVRVNYWLFSSLLCSITAALASVLCQQWIASYSAGMSNSSREDRAWQRQYRHMGARRWKLLNIIGVLPVLMILAVFLFLAGLSDWLWNVYRSISVMVIIWQGFIAFLYLLTSTMSAIDPSVPFRTSFTSAISGITLILVAIPYTIVEKYRPSRHNPAPVESVVSRTLNAAPRLVSWLWLSKDGPFGRLISFSNPFLRRAHHFYASNYVSFREREENAIIRSRSRLESRGLAWLARNLEISTDPNHQILTLFHLDPYVPEDRLVDVARHGPKWAQVFENLLESQFSKPTLDHLPAEEEKNRAQVLCWFALLTHAPPSGTTTGILNSLIQSKDSKLGICANLVYKLNPDRRANPRSQILRCVNALEFIAKPDVASTLRALSSHPDKFLGLALFKTRHNLRDRSEYKEYGMMLNEGMRRICGSSIPYSRTTVLSEMVFTTILTIISEYIRRNIQSRRLNLKEYLKAIELANLKRTENIGVVDGLHSSVQHQLRAKLSHATSLQEANEAFDTIDQVWRVFPENVTVYRAVMDMVVTLSLGPASVGEERSLVERALRYTRNALLLKVEGQDQDRQRPELRELAFDTNINFESMGFVVANLGHIDIAFFPPIQQDGSNHSSDDDIRQDERVAMVDYVIHFLIPIARNALAHTENGDGNAEVEQGVNTLRELVGRPLRLLLSLVDGLGPNSVNADVNESHIASILPNHGDKQGNDIAWKKAVFHWCRCWGMLANGPTPHTAFESDLLDFSDWNRLLTEEVLRFLFKTSHQEHQEFLDANLLSAFQKAVKSSSFSANFVEYGGLEWLDALMQHDDRTVRQCLELVNQLLGTSTGHRTIHGCILLALKATLISHPGPIPEFSKRLADLLCDVAIARRNRSRSASALERKQYEDDNVTTESFNLSGRRKSILLTPFRSPHSIVSQYNQLSFPDLVTMKQWRLFRVDVRIVIWAVNQGHSLEGAARAINDDVEDSPLLTPRRFCLDLASSAAADQISQHLDSEIDWNPRRQPGDLPIVFEVVGPIMQLIRRYDESVDLRRKLIACVSRSLSVDVELEETTWMVKVMSGFGEAISEVLQDWSHVMPSPVEEELEDALSFIIEFCVPIIKGCLQDGRTIEAEQKKDLTQKCTWAPIWLLLSPIIAPDAEPTNTDESGQSWQMAWTCWENTLKVYMGTVAASGDMLGFNAGPESQQWDQERNLKRSEAL